MLNLTFTTKIHVYTAAVDMRKGVHGLSGMVRSEFAADPTDGSLFVFINRRRDRTKILHFDGGGFYLHYRLLEAGSFEELQQPNQSSCLITYIRGEITDRSATTLEIRLDNAVEFQQDTTLPAPAYASNDGKMRTDRWKMRTDRNTTRCSTVTDAGSWRCLTLLRVENGSESEG